MSQSRFSIVLVGVSALLRRPLVSRLRPADGERSSWVVFAARGCRFDSGFRWAGWPSGSLLPLFGMHRFGVAAGRVGSSAFRFGVALGGLVFGLIASAFRHAPIRGGRWASSFFRLPLRKLPSAGWPSGSPLPLFGTHRFGVAARWLAFGFTASAFRHAPFRSGRWAGWPSGSLLPLFGMHRFGDCPRRAASSAFRFGDCPRRVGLRAHCFRFSACAASEWLLGEFVLPPSASEIPLDGLVFGFTASAFRHAPIRSCPRRVGLRAHCFRFSARADSEWPLGGWPSGLLLRRLPFGGLAFGLTASEIALGGLAFGFTASAFRHAPLRRLPSAGWPSGSLLPLFGMRRSAPPRRRSEDRRSTTTRQLFHFKTLIPTC